jgi:hypothetical protein
MMTRGSAEESEEEEEEAQIKAERAQKMDFLRRDRSKSGNDGHLRAVSAASMYGRYGMISTQEVISSR